MHDQWLSNTYLVYDEPGGYAVIIDAGGPVEPLLETVVGENLKLTHLLLTHHHFDHVAELEAVLDRCPHVEVLTHPLEKDHVPKATGTIDAGEKLAIGSLTVEAIATPGHTAGGLSFLVNDQELFTGDTLFRNSVGGVRAPGHTTYQDLKNSIMEGLMKLPASTVVRPGHSEASTVSDEWEGNSFIRLWRGLDDEGSDGCTAMGEQATLILLGDDYDGGHKAWVRWPDGSDDIVPGSAIEAQP